MPVGWAEGQLHKIAMYECQAIGPLDFSRAMQATVRWFDRGYAKRISTAGEPYEKGEPRTEGSRVYLRLEGAGLPEVA